MRALLVYPRYPTTFWSFDEALALVGQRALLPPLGLITVAALLPDHWELRLVDTNVRDLTEHDWQWADIVIVSAMLVQKRDVARCIKEAKAHSLPVAVGGPFASSTPDAPELSQADYLILDEGEITIPAFVAALERGECNGRFSAAGEKPDVTLSPVPRFDLLDRAAYNVMAVQFSRGCPFQCEFCDIIVLYGRRPRTKEPAQLLRELDALHSLGWRGDVFLVDDNFIGNKRNVKRLLPELLAWQLERGFPFAFTTEASVDLAAEPDLMTAMAQCRFQRVFLGIETPDAGSLAGAGKHQNTRHPLVEAVDAITAQGLQVMAGFILGFDGEAPGAGRRIVDFVTTTGIPLAMVGVLQALPNTALWHRLAAEGRLLDDQGGFTDGVQTHLLNFRPSRPMTQIAAEFLDCFDELYEPSAYLRRAFAYCQKLGLPRWPRLGGQQDNSRNWRPLLALIWRQGLRRPTRWLFWKQLVLLAWRRPLLLDSYLWMLLIEEHLLRYRQQVHRDVEAQLASPLLQPPALSGAPAAPPRWVRAADATGALPQR
jgi:radical SAM superfamily enzyme YgiQ (UPF0313 family)